MVLSAKSLSRLSREMHLLYGPRWGWWQKYNLIIYEHRHLRTEVDWIFNATRVCLAPFDKLFVLYCSCCCCLSVCMFFPWACMWSVAILLSVSCRSGSFIWTGKRFYCMSEVLLYNYLIVIINSYRQIATVLPKLLILFIQSEGRGGSIFTQRVTLLFVDCFSNSNQKLSCFLWGTFRTNLYSDLNYMYIETSTLVITL